MSKPIVKIELFTEDGSQGVRLTYDHKEAKGVVEIMAGHYGPTISVDGQPLGMVDLYYGTEEKQPYTQLIIDHPLDGDSLGAIEVHGKHRIIRLDPSVVYQAGRTDPYDPRIVYEMHPDQLVEEEE